MTNRQSNIIFYSVISLIISALAIHFICPDFFDDLTKSKNELSIKESLAKGEHRQALFLYQKLIEEKVKHNDAKSPETAEIYKGMAISYSELGNRSQEKEYYLKSVKIKEQLKEIDTFGITILYDKLGAIAEEDKNYDEAQMYYEKSLSKKLGNNTDEKDEGLLVGMQHSRTQYLRLNNEETIRTFLKLAEIHTIKREYTIVKRYYEQALAASKLTFGEDDDRTLEIMNLMNQLPPPTSD